MVSISAHKIGHLTPEVKAEYLAFSQERHKAWTFEDYLKPLTGLEEESWGALLEEHLYEAYLALGVRVFSKEANDFLSDDLAGVYAEKTIEKVRGTRLLLHPALYFMLFEAERLYLLSKLPQLAGFFSLALTPEGALLGGDLFQSFYEYYFLVGPFSRHDEAIKKKLKETVVELLTPPLSPAGQLLKELLGETSSKFRNYLALDEALEQKFSRAAPQSFYRKLLTTSVALPEDNPQFTASYYTLLVKDVSSFFSENPAKKNYVLEHLCREFLAIGSVEELLSVLALASSEDERLTVPAFKEYMANREQYRGMPKSWWLPLAKG